MFTDKIKFKITSKFKNLRSNLSGKNFINTEKKKFFAKEIEQYFSNAPSWITVPWLLESSIPQSMQFIIDCLPKIRELINKPPMWPQHEVLEVLDVGPSSGAGANLLATLHWGYFFRVQMKVDAIDKSPNYKKFADKYFTNINYIVGDIFKIDKKRTWDLLICSHVIEHLKDPIPFIEELQRRARKWVLIYCPYEEKDLITPHEISISREMIESLKPESFEIMKSPAWYGPTEEKKCALFVLGGKAKRA